MATPAKAKPPASAAVGKAPKGLDILEVKNLDDDELDYKDDVDDAVTGGDLSQPSAPLNVYKPRDTDKTPSRTGVTNPLGTKLLNPQVMNIRGPRIGLGVGRAKGHEVPHEVTRFILEIGVGIVIDRLTGAITIGTVIIGTILVMTCMEVGPSTVFPWPVWWMGL